MIAWTDWETVSHHVSICGRIVNTKDEPMPGVPLSVSAESKQPHKQSDATRARAHARRETTDTQERTGNGSAQTESRLDGTFFFLDCPDGQYTVQAIDSPSGAKAEKSITVADSVLKKPLKDRTPEKGCWIELVLKQ